MNKVSGMLEAFLVEMCFKEAKASLCLLRLDRMRICASFRRGTKAQSLVFSPFGGCREPTSGMPDFAFSHYEPEESNHSDELGTV